VYAPPHARNTTKISVGIGLYYDQTQFSYLIQPYAGIRYDTYYASDGKTPTGSPQQTVFTANDSLLHDPRALNWSVAIERALPWSLYGGVNFMGKRTTNGFTFTNQSVPAALAGNYLLTNARIDQYHSEGMELRKLFKNGYTLYIAYTHSSARTNAALDYLPTPSLFGPQPGGRRWGRSRAVRSPGTRPTARFPGAGCPSTSRGSSGSKRTGTSFMT
jgi:hypothetical protein